MSTPTRRTLARLVPVVLVLGAAGCGSSEKESIAPAAENKPTTSTPSATGAIDEPLKTPRSLGTPSSRPSPTKAKPKPSAAASTTTPASVAPRPSKPSSKAASTPDPLPSGGYPNAASTGVPAGTTLRPGATSQLTISKPGTVIDGKDITAPIHVTASNVTIRNSRIRAANYAIIQVANGVTGVNIVRNEIDGRGFDGAEGSAGVQGPATVRGNDIHGVENGVTPGNGSLVTGNWIHDFAAPGGAHYDGIQIDGPSSNITVENNTIDLNRTQTSAVMIDNYFGPVDNITVRGNRLIGGGYTVYSDGQFGGGAITNVRYLNNKISGGYYGPKYVKQSSPVWSGNVDGSGRAI